MQDKLAVVFKNRQKGFDIDDEKFSDWNISTCRCR